MSTIKDLISLYRNYSDYELIQMCLSEEDYTEVAINALNIVIDEKGGFDSLVDRVEKQCEVDMESVGLREEIFLLLREGKSESSLHILLSARHLSNEQLSDLIREEAQSFNNLKTEQKIRPRTIIGGVFGGLFGSSLASLIWGLQLIYARQFVWFLAIIVFVITYVPIRLLTNQNYKNLLVLLLTLLFGCFAFYLGNILYDFAGYQGPKRY